MSGGKGDKGMKLSRRHTLRVKGQAELIGALFALMVLVMFIVYIVANILPSATRQQLQMQEMHSFKQLQEFEKEGLKAVWNPATNKLKIHNDSPIPVKIVRVWVKKTDGSIEPKQVLLLIEPGDTKELDKREWGPESSDLRPLGVETSRGTIASVEVME